MLTFGSYHVDVKMLMAMMMIISSIIKMTHISVLCNI